jgi:hypothetical protein
MPTVTIDQARVDVPAGTYELIALRVLLDCSADEALLLLCPGGVNRGLPDGGALQVCDGMAFVTTEQMVYRPSPRHKRAPSRGEKGTICPQDVDAQALLTSSCGLESERARWAVDEGGAAYCARSDNVGGWHGYPVRLSKVPNAIVKHWVGEERLTVAMLRADKLRTG